MPSPQKVVAQALATQQPAHTVEEPLSAQEVARFKAHFRFLKEHRHLLKLRVNAAEDLLLNGVREPTHRGLCNHLLAKVERSRVLSVSQSMPALEAVRFLSGIIRFAPEIGYVLRFLECVKETSSQAQAGAAVTEALKQISFSELSAAQVRQLVALIVDVFPERELPVFLLSLLDDESFRAAIDRSLDGFPEVLAGMVRPLRELHAFVVRSGTGRDRAQPSAVDAQAVKSGIELLFEVNALSLVELVEPTRRRLFHVACAAMRSGAKVRAETVEKILSSLSFAQASDRIAATSSLVSALLASDQEARAKKLLGPERKPDDTSSQLARWRANLDAPRVGTVALEGRAGRERPPSHRWARGWHVPTQTAVLVRYGEKGDNDAYAELVATWHQLLVPNVARIVDYSSEINVRPYLAVQLPGAPWSREWHRPIEETVRLGWARDICALLASLAHQGVVLPDIEPSRFNLDSQGGLWLVDLWGLSRCAPEEALRLHCESARPLCKRLIDWAPSYSVSADQLKRIEHADDLRELARLLSG